MTREELISQIKSQKTVLCVGLDTDIQRIPKWIVDEFEDPIFEFNKRIIDATKEDCVAYKFNIAFYEALGPEGWDSLEKSLNHIPESKFTIADAKRGDIGNTSRLYARTFFERYDFDAITVAPYMGEDSLSPFYEYPGKWVIVLGLTSNAGSRDFQLQRLNDGRYLYEEVIEKCASFGDEKNTMFVVGATKTESIADIRKIIPDHFLLMPGIGKQGGDLKSSMEYGLNRDYGLLINSSRGIIYSGGGHEFDKDAGRASKSLTKQMRKYLI